MAVTASGLFYPTFRDILGASQLAIDLDSETDNKLALFTDTITPNFSTDTAYGSAPYDANEASGGSWPTGGVVLTTTAIADAGSAVLKFAAADVSVATTSISAAKCALIYGKQATTKNAIVLINFGGPYTASNGTFAITWSGSGIFTLDLTP